MIGPGQCVDCYLTSTQPCAPSCFRSASEMFERKKPPVRAASKRLLCRSFGCGSTQPPSIAIDCLLTSMPGDLGSAPPRARRGHLRRRPLHQDGPTRRALKLREIHPLGDLHTFILATTSSSVAPLLWLSGVISARHKCSLIVIAETGSHWSNSIPCYGSGAVVLP